MYEGWTQEREEMLRRLWNEERWSASQIATRLGGGISRSAVISKKNRLGLGGRPTVVRSRNNGNSRARLAKMRAALAEKRATKARRKTGGVYLSPQTRPAPMPLPAPQADDIARVSFNDLEPHHCRYIPGEPKGHPMDDPMYCGLQRVDGASYCAGHLRRCQKDAPPLFTPTRPTYHDASAGHSVFGKSRERV